MVSACAIHIYLSLLYDPPPHVAAESWILVNAPIYILPAMEMAKYVKDVWSPHMAARIIHIDNEEKKKIRRLREEQARASQRRDNDSDDGFLISNDNII